MPKDPRMEFEIEITYFEKSGKLCTTEKETRKFRYAGERHRAACNMNDVAAWIRGLRDNGGPGALPGLCSDGWDGYILVNCEQGYPHLILPPGDDV